jgi:RNA polymerase sigma-70 factor (ECF subfamily)
VDDRAGFEDLYSAHAGAVLGFARRRLGAGEADDLVADVFLVAWRRLDDVPDDPLPWLLGVAHRVLANRRRGRQRAAALVGRLVTEELAHSGPEVGVDLDVGVLRALGSLSEADQELLLLVAWEGLDREQLASALGVGSGALAVRLYRARRRFARALEAEDAGVRGVGGQHSSLEVS